jgi:hypothetical protein
MKIFSLTLTFWLLLLGWSAAAPHQVQLLPFDPQALPREIRYPGKVVAGARWLDKEGQNLLLLCETGPFPSPVPPQSRQNPYGERGWAAEVHGYHYVKVKGKYRLLWKMYDLVAICPYDLVATFLPKSLTITDLDGNGIAESTFLYKLGCRSDVSPVPLKLIMHEGKAKYALRGKTMVPGINPDGTPGKIGGQKSLDPGFRHAPQVFRDYALRQWHTFVQEKFGD